MQRTGETRSKVEAGSFYKGGILALCQGHQGCTALIIDAHGRLRGRSYAIVTQDRPQPGWAEYDPYEIWHRSWQSIEHACRAAGIPQGDLAVMGISVQQGTVILWERATGQPVGPAISRNCARAADICQELQAGGYEELFRQRTGRPLDIFASGPKIHWLLAHVPGLFRRAQQGEICCGTVDTWLLWNLTEGQVHATDWTNASATALFNLHTLDWDEEILSLLSIPRAMLPQVYPSGHLYGHLRSEKTLITALCAEEQAGMVGQACFEPDIVKVTYGRDAIVLLEVGDKPLDTAGQLVSVAVPRLDGESPRFALEGHILTAGLVVKWLRDQMALIPTVADSDLLARQVQDSGGVYLIPAFQGLGAPYWDRQARGGVIGLTHTTNRAQLVRAALEGVAYRVRDVIEAIMRWTGLSVTELRADGGAATNDFLMQFQADILGVPVQRNRFAQASEFGGAYLAGLQAGLWASREEIGSLWPAEKRFEPTLEAQTRRLLYQGWRQAVHKLLTSQEKGSISNG